MADADDVYRRLCREAQADAAQFLRDWREREPRVRARDRMLLSHLRTRPDGGAAGPGDAPSPMPTGGNRPRPARDPLHTGPDRRHR